MVMQKYINIIVLLFKYIIDDSECELFASIHKPSKSYGNYDYFIHHIDNYQFLLFVNGDDTIYCNNYPDSV